MNLPFFIARRYLFSRQTTNAVNIITGVSMLGVSIGAAAMIVVLSAFNGLENLIRSFYNTTDPDFRIELVEGKNFIYDEDLNTRIRDVQGVKDASYVLEEKALFRYQGKEFIATLKGVDAHYLEVTNFEDALVHGEFFVPGVDENLAIVGMGVAYHLGISRINMNDPIEIHMPRANASILDPMSAVSSELIYPMGLFSVQPDMDIKYVLVPLPFLQRMSDVKSSRLSSIEVSVVDAKDSKDIKERLQNTLGADFTVLDRDEQQMAIFKVLKTEGLATYLILAFIVLVSSFGILGSNTMLILDKKEDIKTLWAMGADDRLTRRIFFMEGLITSLLGGLGGIALGVIIVLVQQYFGLVGLGDGYVLDSYPVELRFDDFVLILATVVFLGLLVSVISTLKLKKKSLI